MSNSQKMLDALKINVMEVIRTLEAKNKRLRQENEALRHSLALAQSRAASRAGRVPK